MGALLFTVKSVILTIFLIAILQIKVSGVSLEDQLSRYSRETGVLNIADNMAQGAIRLFQNNFNFNFLSAENEESESHTDEIVRAAKLGFSQSERYMSEKSQTAKKAIERFREDLEKDTRIQKEIEAEIQSEDLSDIY